MMEIHVTKVSNNTFEIRFGTHSILLETMEFLDLYEKIANILGE